MSNERTHISRLFASWRKDWNKFLVDVFDVHLDAEQRKILRAVQHNKRVSVRSGTARGKDYVAACAAVCFLYLTPKWDAEGNMIENTKVALTAPTDRQVKNIMMPEVSRLITRAHKRGFGLCGNLTQQAIRMRQEEWFLVGFKADEHNHEAWSGFHAVHTMFVVTEATGISDDTFSAIEGNLQGDSRILLVFNPNTTVGYAAKSQKSDRWVRFCLNSLTAPNVLKKQNIVPGQVDYEWVADKVANWCMPISEQDVDAGEDDFRFEGAWYRPSDLFRRKVLGAFPKVDEDKLIPPAWIELAQERWRQNRRQSQEPCVIGVDIAGMGRDATVLCYRRGNRVEQIVKRNSAGKANHMQIAGNICHELQTLKGSTASIDTIGEGAGVYSRCVEVMGNDAARVISCKNSEAAKDARGREYTDITGEYKFKNMRAYLHWCVRDWLNPINGFNAELPPNGSIYEEATAIGWSFDSTGRIIIEPKDDIKARIEHSPDEWDALCNTFHPMALQRLNYSPESEQSIYDIEDIIY